MERDELMEKISDLINQFYSSKIDSFVPGKTQIPIAKPPYDAKEIIEVIDSLTSTWVTMGKKVRKFEEKFAEYIGTKHAIMVNSGSSANLLALAILTNPKLKNRLQPNDEIITPALTWVTTVYPILNNNLKPVFVDVELDSFNIDPEKIQNAITEKTKAIIPIHVLGNPAKIEQIKKIADDNNLFLIEDACEAHGAEVGGKKVGSFGDLSTFSFFLSHHITTIEGGMILTNNDEFCELGKALRAFGWVRDLQNKSELKKQYSSIDDRFLFVNLGFNIRPTDLQGAMGIHQIEKLEKFIEIRISNMHYWNGELSRYANYLQLPQENSDRHVSFGYAITVKNNAPFSSQELMNFLESQKIETRPVMAGNIVNQPVSQLFDYRVVGSLENSEKITQNSFWIPNHQDIGKDEREYIASCIHKFMEVNQTNL